MNLSLAEQRTAPNSGEMPLDEAAIQLWLVAHIASMLKQPEDSIDPLLPFAHYGLDSVASAGLSGDLEVLLDRQLPATLAWDFPTIELLARHLAQP